MDLDLVSSDVSYFPVSQSVFLVSFQTGYALMREWLVKSCSLFHICSCALLLYVFLFLFFPI